jgi:hypothetical protein
MKSFFIFFILFQFASLVFAKSIQHKAPSSWSEFEEMMNQQLQKNEVTGVSYMLSGAATLIGGLAGAQGAQDIYSRSVFALVQSFGVTAIGYGAGIYWNGGSYNSFYLAVRDSSLNANQKNELLRNYLNYEKQEKERERWIKAGTHFLLTALNAYSASKEENKDVKGIFQFLAGANLVIGLTYSF